MDVTYISIMAHQQPKPRDRLEPEQFMALWQACRSNDTAPLESLVETLNPPINEFLTGLCIAIRNKHLDMVRYILERGFPVKGDIVQEALRARSIPILEMLREFGWDDVNMSLDSVACTALR